MLDSYMHEGCAAVQRIDVDRFLSKTNDRCASRIVGGA